ncbi:hypothetical protein I5G87_gp51 [Mycobacterium phage Ekdilam]|uniref:Uncharacterized protein n=1 Tax=Mycobacterium phage Ekdilam TaxID=2599862 RepID=A0A5J6TKX0_9CAUD|nr:hypothetical protein I5G87_gp51 [Mycobacterium phage Ekdilam]QFG11475.1 hypothetical protein PBI_EKDILAM_51 [Mycobacterium phage Ekdilam]
MSVPMCQACRAFPAHVFDPDGSMRCGGCAYLDLPTASSATEAGDPEVWAEAMSESRRNVANLLEFIQSTPVTFAPKRADSLDDADRAYIWGDAEGVHWGWVEHNGWCAWGSSPVVPWGRPAVGPFTALYLRPVGEFAPGGFVSNPAGEALSCDDAEASNVVPIPLRSIKYNAVEVFDVEPAAVVDDQADDADGDMVNHPAHYTQGPPCKGCGRPIECLDVTEGMGFCLGNTVKYVWRCDLKHDAIEDLRKARVYLDREIARREQQSAANEIKG